MCRSPNKRVEISKTRYTITSILLVTDLEVDVQAVERACVVEVSHKILHHRVVVIAFACPIIRGFFAHLNSCGIERHILVLERRNQNYVLEMMQPCSLR